MSEVDSTDDVDELIRRFSTSEASLRSMMAELGKFTNAREAMGIARTELSAARVDSVAQLEIVRSSMRSELELAEASFSSAENSLNDLASGVFAMTVELKNIARDMKDSATAWRSVGPDTLKASLAEVAKDLEVMSRKQDQFRIWAGALMVLVLAVGGLAVAL
jgi:hypothetical protein